MKPLYPESFPMFWSLPQVLGYLGFILTIIAFLQKVDIRLKLISAIGCGVFSLHYFLLNDFTAASIMLISVARNTTSMYTRSRWAAGFFICIIIIAGYFTAKHWFSILLIFGQIWSTIALFFFQGIALRAVFSMSASFWLINNISVGSIGGIATECCNLVAHSITIARLFKDRRKKVS